MTTPTARAGWYPDPAGMPCGRWWDGYRWTDQTIAAAQMQMLAAQQRTAKNSNLLVNVVLIVVFLGVVFAIGYGLKH